MQLHGTRNRHSLINRQRTLHIQNLNQFHVSNPPAIVAALHPSPSQLLQTSQGTNVGVRSLDFKSERVFQFCQAQELLCIVAELRQSRASLHRAARGELRCWRRCPFANLDSPVQAATPVCSVPRAVVCPACDNVSGGNAWPMRRTFITCAFDTALASLRRWFSEGEKHLVMEYYWGNVTATRDW